jgi:hypothetical protein
VEGKRVAVVLWWTKITVATIRKQPQVGEATLRKFSAFEKDNGETSW